MKMPANKKSLKRPAQGFVLLLIVLTMLAIAGVVFLNGVGTSLSGSQRQVAQAQAANDVLVAAKAALLGYVVQTTDGGGGFRLGNLPMPDALNTAGNAIQYDGMQDTKCLSTGLNGLNGITPGASLQSAQRCLGKFPWRDFNLDVGNPDPNDPTGQVPWLAISSNLNVLDKCLDKLNSDTLNWSLSNSNNCPTTANPTPNSLLPYPWLTVVDQYGKTVSNVAAVLIMPGPPIETGSRTQSRLATYPNVTDYLDAISLPLGCVSSCTGTYDNADLSNVFVQIPLGTKYPTNAENASLAGQPIKFNDVLVYITINELMPYIERRVLSEMSAAVKDSKSKTTTYPWAVAFSSPVSYSNFMSLPGTQFGLFPFFNSSVPSSYQTDFNWEVKSVPALTKSCQQVQFSPNRFVDMNQNLRADYYSGTINQGSASGALSTCLWYGNTGLSCKYTPGNVTSSKSFTLYSNSSCTTIASGSPATYAVTRSVSVIADPLCAPANLAPTVYQPANATNPQRLEWQCSLVKPGAGSVFTVNAGDTIASPPVSSSFSINGVSKPVKVSNMRYQPIMPTWFYNNDWYLTAFYAVAPSKAPSPVTPCGITTQLSAGANSGGDAIVMLAGSRLPNLPAAPTQIRPSASLYQYLEEPNLSAGTSCAFSASRMTTTSTSNDQVLVISP